MSLKAEIETWAMALAAYEDQEFEMSIELFSRIADSSKILVNIGVIYATMGEHELAVENFNAATQLDQYHAVAYFQCGVSNFLLGRYELAYTDFEEAFLYLRGNQSVNYQQIGLKFLLYSAEVLFNKALCQIYMGKIDLGLALMRDARAEKVTQEHSVIDEALADQGEGYTVFSIPVGVVYRPPEGKLKNIKTRDYMGTAILLGSETKNEFITTARDQTLLPPVSRTPSQIQRSASIGGTAPGATVKRANTTLNVGSGPSVQRSNTLNFDPLQPSNIQRSNTTLNANAFQSSASASVQRSNTSINVTPPSARGDQFGSGVALTKSSSLTGTGASATAGRAPSVRGPGPGGPGGARGPGGVGVGRNASIGSAREGGTVSPPRQGAVSPPRQQPPESRVTQIYDDYMDAYGAEADDVPPLPVGGLRPGQMGRQGSVNRPPAPGSAYSGSSISGRRSVRRVGVGRTPSRATSRAMSFYEDEEGYASGDEDLIKIRVKLHYDEDTRGMAITSDMPFEEFIGKVCSKFERPYGSLNFKFRDEDGGKVSLKDETDYDLAIETARHSGKGKPEGRLDVWCTDA